MQKGFITMKHLLKLLDCSTEEIIGLLDLADQLKYEKKHNISHRHLEGKSLGMIFQMTMGNVVLFLILELIRQIEQTDDLLGGAVKQLQ